MSLLEIHNIHHIYFSEHDATRALENISLSIEEGEFISLLGPSGCGKTTLLSIIAGLVNATEGSITIKGEPNQNRHSNMGYMLQQDYLFPWKTIEENIFLGLKIMKLDTPSNKEKALQLLDNIGLQGVLHQYPDQLSGGMRQRVALVRTLATDPKILLLDEPFSALDYQTKLKLEDLVFKTLKEYNKTAILVTHDISEAIAMSDRIFMLKANPGQVHRTFIVPEDLRKATPFEVRQHPQFSEVFQKIWRELDLLENQVKS